MEVGAGHGGGGGVCVCVGLVGLVVLRNDYGCVTQFEHLWKLVLTNPAMKCTET